MRRHLTAVVLAALAGGCASAPRPDPTPGVLRIISTNDFHGAFESRPEGSRQLGGAAHLATAISRARSECGVGCTALLLDGGDMFQGTPASNLAYGRPVVDLYNKLGYVAAALGNHEFDWGQDTLQARMRQARYAILGANVKHADGRDVEWIRDDTLVDRGGVRIGIIGIATTSTPTTTKAEHVAGLKFLLPAPVVDDRVRALRARGATVIVVVAHAGAFCSQDGTTACAGEIVELAHALTEKVDAIVSGHSHSLVSSRVNNIPIIQARSGGRAIAVLDVPLSGATREPRSTVRTVSVDSFPPDAGVDSLVRTALTGVAWLVNRAYGEIAEPLPRTEGQYGLGNLIADAMRASGKADAAVMNNGGIRANLAAGTATYGRLFEVQPFGNVLYKVTLDGKQFREYFERVVQTERRGTPNVHVSGVRIRYDPSLPAGSRITLLTLADGTDPRPEGTYTVVINDFMLTGGDNLAPPAGVPSQSLVADLDALIAYIQSQPQPIRAWADPRIGRSQ